MGESEFLAQAEPALHAIESALDRLNDDDLLDVECSRSGNVLEIEFIANGSKIIVNSQAAMSELWVAARSGGFHYKQRTACGSTRATAPSCSPRCRRWSARRPARRSCWPAPPNKHHPGAGAGRHPGRSAAGSGPAAPQATPPDQDRAACSSNLRHAAVDEQLDAVDEAGRVGGEESHRLAD